jgi:hypothetical protein
MDPDSASANSIATLLHRLCILQATLESTSDNLCTVDDLSVASLGADYIVCAWSAVGRTRRCKITTTQSGMAGDASKQSSLIDVTSELSFHSSDSFGFPRVRGGQGWFGFIGSIVLSILYVAIAYSGWSAIGAASGLTLFSPRLYAILRRDHVIEFDKGTVDQLSVAATATEEWIE